MRTQGLPTFLCKVRSKTTDTSSSTALLTRLRHATTYNFERLASHASRFMQDTTMSTFTAQGQQLVSDLSSRTGFSQDAVTHMLIAVLNGNGTMADLSLTPLPICGASGGRMSWRLRLNPWTGLIASASSLLVTHAVPVTLFSGIEPGLKATVKNAGRADYEKAFHPLPSPAAGQGF